MISVVMPVYNEGAQICAHVHTVDDILTQAGIEHGFLLVDDGSADDTWAQLNRTADEVANTQLLRLSRNFGKEAALCAALENADADAVVVMDSDLQHPPAVIVEMVRLWREEGYDVVDGVKRSRGKENPVYGACARLYYMLFARMTGVDLGQASDFKLMDREALEAWRTCRESNTFFRGMSAWVGFRHTQVPFEVAPREGGTSKWSFRALAKLFLTSITAYTAAPLMGVLWLGAAMGLAGFILLVQTLYMYFSHRALTGFSTVIILQLLIGWGVMTGIAVVGLYVSKIYDEVKGRPRYLIREKRGGALTKPQGGAAPESR